MAEEEDQPEISNDSEPTVMPTAFEIHDESYNPKPRPLVRKMG